MNKPVKDCGAVHLTMEELGNTMAQNHQGIGPVCGYHLWKRPSGGCNQAETVYIREIKREKAPAKKVTEKELEAIKTGPLRVKIRKKQ